MGQRRLGFFLATGVILALLGLPVCASAFTPAQRTALRAAAAQDQAEGGYPGLVVGVWQKGEGRFISATGTSDLRTHRHVRTTDIFRIGSITKTFTATVILQLAEGGLLRLSDPIDRYVSGIKHVHKVTIRDLLGQVSGFPDIDIKTVAQVFLSPHKEWQTRRIVRKSLRQPRVCAPRKCWHYSNINYLLLGIIAQKASGETLPQLYESGILKPLGLRDTSFAPSRPVPAPAAHGYVALPVGPPVQDTSGWNFSWIWSAGGFNSTLWDLRRYVPALVTGHGLLSPAMQRRRLDLRNVSQETVPGGKYGLGIFQIPTKLGKFLGHNGAVPGYDSVALYSPSRKITLVAIGNTSVEQFPVRGSPEAPSMLFNLAPDLISALAKNR
jgi:D-alanyl-D-alanine carboxypeptidase